MTARLFLNSSFAQDDRRHWVISQEGSLDECRPGFFADVGVPREPLLVNHGEIMDDCLPIWHKVLAVLELRDHSLTKPARRSAAFTRGNS